MIFQVVSFLISIKVGYIFIPCLLFGSVELAVLKFENIKLGSAENPQ